MFCSLLAEQVWKQLRLIRESFSNFREPRNVAQFGRVLEWGSSGRWFESTHSDYVVYFSSSSFKNSMNSAGVCA